MNVLVWSSGYFRPGKSPSGHCHVFFFPRKNKLPTTKTYLKSVLVVGRESVNGHQQQEKFSIWGSSSPLLVVCDSNRTRELHFNRFQVSWIFRVMEYVSEVAGWNVTGQHLLSDLSLLKGNSVHYEPSEMIKYMLFLSCLLNLLDMRSDQRALWLEVKKQIIKYLDSDFFLSWFGLKWSVLNKFWSAKDQNQLKLWNNVHYVSIFYFTYKKTLSQLPQIKIFSWCDFFFVLLKNMWSKCVFFF